MERPIDDLTHLLPQERANLLVLEELYLKSLNSPVLAQGYQDMIAETKKLIAILEEQDEQYQRDTKKDAGENPSDQTLFRWH